jgi:hypothetical protein
VSVFAWRFIDKKNSHLVDKQCGEELKEFTMNDVYLQGIIEKGQKYEVILNYYKCHHIQRDDIVLYSFSQSLEPVIKKVVAVGGDNFDVTKDDQHHAWNLKVNNLIIRTPGLENYYFGSETPPTLALYIKPRRGVLKQNEVIVLSTVSPGNTDSGILGVASIRDLVGKIIR